MPFYGFWLEDVPVKAVENLEVGEQVIFPVDDLGNAFYMRIYEVCAVGGNQTVIKTIDNSGNRFSYIFKNGSYLYTIF